MIFDELRALARAAALGPLKVMLPMVTVPAARDWATDRARSPDSIRGYRLSPGQLVAATSRWPRIVAGSTPNSAAAQARTLTPDEMTGNTFTISNVGSYAGKYATMIAVAWLVLFVL